ncbi:MAG: DUF1800 domain-containing protein [FCB group bacterium]|jgi:uncharacterized protein (DUF1800 family)
MDRRKFLSGNLLQGNKKNEARVLSGIEPYTGTFGSRQAWHLLRRTTFGPSPKQINDFSKMTLNDAINALFQAQSAPSPPVDPATGITWVDKPYNGTNNSHYVRYNKDWWLGLMMSGAMNIIEKMTLFWHNHFVSDSATVADARYVYKQNALLRQYALGNIKDFVKEVTKDPAMLRYLNGNTNVASHPNENYGREFQELFTIGKGPEIQPGNYTNYTEDDVKAAAKVLTGWRDTSSSVTSAFYPNSHDTSDKQFSSDYGNTIIKGRTGASAGDDELNDLVDMIFSQQATALFLCREIYRWFVYYEIDDTTEQNVIEPLADLLRTNNYEVQPVLETLLGSAHFFDDANIGCMIKNPVDFNTQLLLFLEIQMPDPVKDTPNYYNYLDKLILAQTEIGMALLDPPNVAGWSAYYQVPDYYRLWMNTVTMPLRNGFTDALVNGTMYFGNSFKLDIIAYIKKVVSDPTDAATIVAELADALFIDSLTQKQKDYVLNTVFMQGLPAYEWTSAWNAYISNPDTANTTAVKNSLNPLFRFLFRMAEFQLM